MLLAYMRAFLLYNINITANFVKTHGYGIDLNM